jgi:dihydroorotate dehydrogenase
MLDLGTTLAGVRLPFCAMNAAGTAQGAGDLRALAASESGAIVLRTATVHPFLHPEFRSLHNPGYDRLLPLVRELAAGPKPVIASIAGATPEEYGVLAHAFAEAGAALVEANLAEAWVEASLAPLEDLEVLRAVLQKLVSASRVPVAVKLPPRPPVPYRRLGEALRAAGVAAVVARNEFTGYEKLLLEGGGGFDVVAVGGIRSGYDVRRALAKGARAVQVGSGLTAEGPAMFARLAREMRAARGL